MECKNELLDAWLGEAVLVGMWLGSNVTGETITFLFENPEQARLADDVQVCAQVVELVAYDSLGVVLRERRENAYRFFMPWSAVLSIQGFDPHVEPGGTAPMT